MKNYTFDFIPQGAQITVTEEHFEFLKRKNNSEVELVKWSRANTIILDTGNYLMPGIIDHHQPDLSVAESCVASLVVQDADRYLAHLKDQKEVVVITHFSPDLDAVGAVYFTLKYLDNKPFTAFDQLLSDYILEVDSGKLSIDPEYPVSIASIWLAVTNQKNKLVDNQLIVSKGINFFDKISELLLINSSPWSVSFLRNLTGFEEEINQIHEDIESYKLDFETKSSCYSIQLFNILRGGKDVLDVIITSQPTSFLWKYWVRGDRKRSPNKEGFIVTCAHFTNRSIISVDPNMPYNLKGLGLLIDHAEVKILQSSDTLELIENGPLDETGKSGGKRGGFHRNDPWYDGRGFHNFTIIDAPRAGTKLTEETLNELILSTELWQNYGVYLDELIEDSENKNGMNEVLKNLTLDELLQLPLPEKDSKDHLIELELPQSLNIIDLSLENQLKYIDLLEKSRFQVKKDLLNEYWYRENCQQYIRLIGESLNSLPTTSFYELKKTISFQVADKIDFEGVKLFLMVTNDLPKEAVIRCLSKVKYIVDFNKYMNFLMDVQNLHPQTFHLNANDFFEKTSTTKFDLITYFPASEELQYDLPLYTYNNLKNYFDDLIVCSEYAGANYEFDASKEYIAMDFSSNFNENGIGTASLLKTALLFNEYKEHVFDCVFKSKLEDLRIIRNETLKSTKGITAKIIKQYSVEELLRLNYLEIKQLIKILKPDLQENGKEYLSVLNFIEIVASISNLQLRLANFTKLVDTNFEFHFSGNQFLSCLNRIVYNLFYSQSIYLQYTDSEQVEGVLNDTMGLVNVLRTLQDQSPEIEINDFSEVLIDFVNNILSELNLPMEEMEQLLQVNTSQYQLINGNDGLIELIRSTFPSFYQYFLLEIFIAFKRYYAEKIYFIREEMLRLVELSDSQEEEKANLVFDKLYASILNASITYDWQEVKDQVDIENNVDKKLFYKKYFSWISTNFEKTDSNDLLTQLNSKIRFSIGKSKGNLDLLVQKLPEPLPSISYKELQKKMVHNVKSSYIISHFPNKFLHQSFDFISKLYIDKFDVDTAKRGLISYSTEFPFYYRWLTKTNVLRIISIVLIAMLFLVGCFDGNVYKFGDLSENAPIATQIKTFLSPSIFYVFSKLFSGFWILILSLSFTLPIIMFLLVIKNYFTNDAEKGAVRSFKFLELIQSTEANQSNLLYFSFVVPLIFVVVQMASSDTIEMINNITGIRLISTLIIIIGLTISAVYMHVKERNKYKNTAWLLKKTEHMFWLHILQALLITIFIIDLMLRLDVSIESFQSHDDLFSAGISKFIKLEIGPFDFIIMPIFTLLVALLTLFFSFFIDKVLGSKE
jgi:hypothetical protein